MRTLSNTTYLPSYLPRIPLEMPFRLQCPDLPEHHHCQTCITHSRQKIPMSCVHANATVFYQTLNGRWQGGIFKICKKIFIT